VYGPDARRPCAVAPTGAARHERAVSVDVARCRRPAPTPAREPSDWPPRPNLLIVRQRSRLAASMSGFCARFQAHSSFGPWFSPLRARTGITRSAGWGRAAVNGRCCDSSLQWGAAISPRPLSASFLQREGVPYAAYRSRRVSVRGCLQRTGRRFTNVAIDRGPRAGSNAGAGRRAASFPRDIHGTEQGRAELPSNLSPHHTQSHRHRHG